jgi:hypothetical protein
VKCLNPLVLLLASLAAPLGSNATILYTYDFPGVPGSGLAVDQANSQPADATFGDFTRQGTVSSGGGNGVFDTKDWSLGTSIDLTQFEGFSITAAASHSLNLTQLSFDITNAGNGPANFQVALYLNGSSTAYASQTWDTRGTTQTLTFDFTDLTDADNATNATFKFYGWNSASAGAHLILDNVATSGAIVPEPKQSAIVVFIFLGAVLSFDFRRRRRATRAE